MILNILLWLILAIIAAFHAWPRRTLNQSNPASWRKFLPIIFFALLGFSLPTWRFSFLHFPVELDIDESHYLAAALTFQTDWMPWRSADGHTVGPLDFYILMWPSAVSLPISYFTARVTELACIFITLLFSQKLTSIIVGEAWSLLGIFPLVTFYAFANNNEYVHYASEDLPVALLSLSAWTALFFYIRPARKTACLLGLVVGAICFAKLQAAPLAIYLFIIAAVLAYRRLGMGKTLGILYGILILSAAIIPVLITLPVLMAGYGPDFFKRFIMVSAFCDANTLSGSTKPQSLTSLMANFFILLRIGAEARAYLISLFCLGIGFMGFLVSRRHRLPASWYAGMAVVSGYLLIALMTVAKPGTAYSHYLFLILSPVLLVVQWLARGCRYGGTRSIRRDIALVWIYLCVGSFPILFYQAVSAPKTSATSSPIPSDPVVAYIESMAQAHDRLAVWGAAPRYFVLTQLPSATRDVVCYLDILPDSYFDYYRAEYVDDIKRAKPRFLVDAVPENYYPGWPRPLEKARCTAYPPLRDYLQNNYLLVKEIRHENQAPTLIYLRK